MLADVRDKLVRSVELTLDIDQISGEFIEDLEKFTVNEHGKNLKFFIHDPQSNTNIRLFSRNRHVMLDDSFMEYLQKKAAFEFRFA